MAHVDVHRIFDRIAHLYDTGWLQRALYAAVQEVALTELRLVQPRTGRVLAPGGHALVGMINPRTAAGARRSAGRRRWS